MDIAAIWTVTINVLLVILGINALIIVHEFGHFAVARLCGVRCEKFYIWFDFWGLKFFKFKWGDTEYGLGLFPLGGYVKMLGQEDDPGKIQAEIERAKKQAVENGQTGTPSPLFAPDSYLAKSVPQRLAIIVAGVTMNFLFAIVCAAGAYMIGVQETPPVVGNTIAGSPAWEAGLQTGDKIIEIDGSPARIFNDIVMSMIGGAKTVTLTIDRENELQKITVVPRKRKADLAPMIGVTSLPGLQLAGLNRYTLNPYPGEEKYYDADTLKKLDAAIKSSDETNTLIEKVDGQAVKNYAEYQEHLLKKFDQPISVTLNNGMEVDIPAIPNLEIPCRFKMGTVVSILAGSDAEKQGIVPGDIIVSVDGDADIDPLKLPQILLRKVNADQKSVEVEIRKQSGELKKLTIELKPVRFFPDLSVLSMRDPVGSMAIGLAWNVEPVIVAVGELPADSGQTLPAVGDKVVGVEIVGTKPILNKNSFSEATDDGFFIHHIGDKVDVPYIFSFLLQKAGIKKSTDKQTKKEQNKIISVKLTLESPDGKIKVVNLPVNLASDWFVTDRGLLLMTERTVLKAANIGDALSLGTVKMVDFSFLIFKTLQSLMSGTVSAKAMGGPVMIVGLAYQVANDGMSTYLMFLCLIGANLAVINIFPMPPLDGGHVVFLLYEGIFRRPPNELVQVILSYVGLLLILALMIWTLSLDLSCIPRM